MDGAQIDAGQPRPHATGAGVVDLFLDSIGFSIVGTLPQAFRHRDLGLVDASVMHRLLDDFPEA